MATKIDTVWLALTVNLQTGDEVMCAVLVDNETTPLITFDADRVEAMTEQAEDIAVQHGIDIRIAKFTTRHDIGFISGKAMMALKVKWPPEEPGNA